MNSDFQAVRENLFPASHGAIEDWEAFPWHRDRTNRIQAHKAHSSQAIAIDVFGTVKMSTDRDRIFDAIAARVGVAPGGPWEIALEWTDTDRLLEEPRPTQVDALAVGSKAALVIECKFTEPGGKCSQTAVLRSGERQCNGGYADQINPGSAPTADEEIAFLDTGRNGKAASLTIEKARAAAVEDTSQQHLLELDRKRRRIVTMAAPGDLATRSSTSEEKFLNYMLGDPIKTLRVNEPLTIGEARSASQRAFLGQDPVGFRKIPAPAAQNRGALQKPLERTQN
ncbi:PGN_0703 family putative restriction endonuclease [Rhizobium anhuiense]|uniref:PGN_0703 family putative restriction endonuclease n=1 Tax=Rhizobium anhuiense TaxID=1184720 RepID=UPI001FEEB046|nr:hypothetical protein [Rhizobium anhuiense]UTS88207.1 hypothetical protein NE851_01035 [Rhizobium anhuiense bv. trifolii]